MTTVVHSFLHKYIHAHLALSFDRCIFVLYWMVENLCLCAAYWQSAVAARPSAAWKGYIIGGLLW